MEANKLSLSEKLKYNEYHKNLSYANWMFFLAVVLVILSFFFMIHVYESLKPSDNKYQYFKYDQYVLSVLTLAVFLTSAYFAIVEYNEAVDRIEELLLEEEPATASDEQKKLAATPPPPVVPK